VRRLFSVAIVIVVVGIGVAATVEALRESPSEETSARRTTGGATTSAKGLPTTAATTATVTDVNTPPTATEPIIVTDLADVPTITERGTDVVPKSAPPWHQELAVCKARSFRLLYDRDIPAMLVSADDAVLAWAGLQRRDLSKECRSVPRKRPVVRREPPPEGIYESVEVRCTAPEEILIDVRPVESNGSVYGSILAVWLAEDSPLPRLGTTDWLVAAIAVNDVQGRRVDLNQKYCALS
jgi:hypothetical protein